MTPSRDGTVPLLFGANIDPSVGKLRLAFEIARVADERGLDLVTIQDHPYNPDFLDTWTLMTAIAQATRRVHVGANVLNTPLRPPAMLAKAAASLQVLSGGRVELGLGAGAFAEAIVGLGGTMGTPGERFRAFKESLEIIQGLLASGGEPFTYEGAVHRLTGVEFGPQPEPPIRVWLGVTGPRALRLTGARADGLLISATYVPAEQLPEVNRLLDEGAAAAGRPPSAIRRGYNLMGVLARPDGRRMRAARPSIIVGAADHWAAEIARFVRDYRQDTFIFWPLGGNEAGQIEAFAAEVVPAVRERLEAPGATAAGQG